MGKICYHHQKTAKERIQEHIELCRNGEPMSEKQINHKTKHWDSPIEKRLLQAMQKRNLTPISQYKILNFRVDFAFPKQKLVIECDGSKYHGEEGTLWLRDDYEGRRHFLIKKEGWKILRFTGDEINNNSDKIAYRIYKSIQSINNPIQIPENNNNNYINNSNRTKTWYPNH